MRGAQPGLDAALDQHEGGAGGAHRRRGAFFFSPETFLLVGVFRRVLSSFLLSTFCPSPPLPPFLFLFSTPPLSPRQVVAEAPLYGFEQEYTMLTNTGNVYGWPQGGYPAPQGPFYCGVGSTSVYGRPLAEAHMVSGGGRGRGRGEREGAQGVQLLSFPLSFLFHSLIDDASCGPRNPKKPGKTKIINRMRASRPASSSPASTPRSCPASGSSRSGPSARSRSATR